jgi:hypothetical protein
MVAQLCAVGFLGRNRPRGCSGHSRPGGDLLVLHQGRFVALCAMNLAGNTCNNDDDDDNDGASRVGVTGLESVSVFCNEIGKSCNDCRCERLCEQRCIE